MSRRRRIVVGALGAVAVVGFVPAAASASVWSQAVRLTTSGAPFSALGVGAFAQPDGSFLLSGYSDFHSLPGGAGNTTGVAGGVFPAPTGPIVSAVVWLPDGSSLVGFNGSVQRRSVAGTLDGAPQVISSGPDAFGVDSSGNATAVGVANNNGFTLSSYSRPVGVTLFTAAAAPVATSGAGSQMTLIGLVVDPNGAAVVTWLQDASTIKQATRAVGASSFGAPVVVATDATNGVAPNGASLASNSAGRAVLVYYDGNGYSAAIRNPGGAFGMPVDITGALPATVPNSVSAVAADGTAATLVGDAVGPGCGLFYRLHAYGLAAAGTAWTGAGVFGGTPGNSIADAALAGGPGSRIDAAWSLDTRSAAQECTTADAYEVQVGTLGGQMSTIYTGAPPAGPTYGSIYTGGFTPAIALNSCGAGALVVGIADPSNADTHDGLFTSTTAATGACTSGGTKPANIALPAITGKPGVGQKLSASTGTWSGTAPITYAYQWQRCKPSCASIAGATSSSYTLSAADLGAKVGVTVTASNAAGSASATSAQLGPIGPSAGAIKALLSKLLAPNGALAKIAPILKHGGYSLSFTAPSAGKLSISWYLGPKGAHVSAAKKPVLIAAGKVSFGKAGKVKLSIKLNAKGKRLLKHSHKLKLTAKGAYTPAGGSAISATESFTLKG